MKHEFAHLFPGIRRCTPVSQPRPTTPSAKSCVHAARAKRLVQISPRESARAEIERVLAVDIGLGEACYVLRSKGRPNLSLLPKLNAFWSLFVEKVNAEAASEVVPCAVLNQLAVTSVDFTPDELEKRVLAEVRNLKRDVCKLLDEWGTPEDGKPWLEAHRGHGYYLNKSINWTVKRVTSSPRSIATKNIEDTPRREDKLPTRPRRKMAANYD